MGSRLPTPDSGRPPPNCCRRSRSVLLPGAPPAHREARRLPSGRRPRPQMRPEALHAGLPAAAGRAAARPALRHPRPRPLPRPALGCFSRKPESISVGPFNSGTWLGLVSLQNPAVFVMSQQILLWFGTVTTSSLRKTVDGGVRVGKGAG